MPKGGVAGTETVVEKKGFAGVIEKVKLAVKGEKDAPKVAGGEGAVGGDGMAGGSG